MIVRTRLMRANEDGHVFPQDEVDKLVGQEVNYVVDETHTRLTVLDAAIEDGWVVVELDVPD